MLSKKGNKTHNLRPPFSYMWLNKIKYPLIKIIFTIQKNNSYQKKYQQQRYKEKDFCNYPVMCKP